MQNKPTGCGTPPPSDRFAAPAISSDASTTSAKIIAFPPEKTVSAKSIHLTPLGGGGGGGGGGEGGEGGEGGIAATFPPSSLSNRQFAEAIFADTPEGARPLITAKAGEPTMGPWVAYDAKDMERVCTPNLNTYINCASFWPLEEGSVAATKAQVAAYHFLLLDDVGTKVNASRVAVLKPTWKIETSPGNYQVGFKLRTPLRDQTQATNLLDRVAAAGLTDKGAKGINRWARLPNGINGKLKHFRGSAAFVCKLFEWNAEVSYTAEELLEAFAPEASSPDEIKAPEKPTRRAGTNAPEDTVVYTPKPAGNPVVEALKAQNLYKRDLGGGKHDVTCLRVSEHTDELDTGACYFEPDSNHPFGGFKCLHSHGDELHVSHLIDHLRLDLQTAKGKPLIRVIEGQLNAVVRAAEHVLSQQSNFYQAGNAIVRVRYDAQGEPALEAVTETALTLTLAGICDWRKYDRRRSQWVACDPPEKVVRHLLKATPYHYLRELEGFAHQPFYRSNGMELVSEAGYDEQSRRLAVFESARFVMPVPSRSAAESALTVLHELLGEFHFATEVDQAATLSAVLTAIVRPSLETAPAYHVAAPSPGSGKSLLCNVIARLASAKEPLRLPYPKEAQEADKVIFASLLTQPPTIMFDDMTDDWKAHGVINSVLTAPTITGRILGVSKTATVSTRILFLGSGNNVGPIQDLSRRVITINLNARSESPATLKYERDPMAALQTNREKYVVAGLTLIEAYRAAGSPRTDVPPIASYNGAWASYCRHPLIWLGLPDPASILIEQVRQDRTVQHLGALLEAWHSEFGDRAVKVAELLGAAPYSELGEAVSELPIAFKGQVDPTSLGKYLAKNKNRPIGVFILEEGPKGKRRTWIVRRLEAERQSPPSPP